jgi:hypothetical protein
VRLLWQAIKLTVECFEAGLAGCVCAMALSLRPEWLDPKDGRYSPEDKCYQGNPLDLLMKYIGRALAGPFISFGNSIANAFKDLFGGYSQRDAEIAFHDNLAKHECGITDAMGMEAGTQAECYYKRITAICHSDELYHLFLRAHGPAYDVFQSAPKAERQATAQLIDQIDLFKEPIGLCRAHAQITLDMLIEACGARPPPSFHIILMQLLTHHFWLILYPLPRQSSR